MTEGFRAATPAPKRPWGRAALLVPVALSIAACGAAPAAPASARASLAVRESSRRPRLVVLPREGDPFPGLALAIATRSASRETAALAGLVEARLARAGLDATLFVGRSSVFVDLPSSTPLVTLQAVATALKPGPVTDGELSAARRRIEALSRQVVEPEKEPVAACTGELGLPTAAAPLDSAELAQIASRELRLEALSLGAVGSPAWIHSVEAALGAVEAWPNERARAAEPWPARDEAVSTSLPGAGAVVHFAARTARGGDALAAADRLGAPLSSLSARLGALGESWKLTRVVASTLPEGACVAITAESAESVDGEAVARALEVARVEVLAELSTGGPHALGQRRVMEATDPRDASRRAAWWGLTADGTQPTRLVASVVAPAPPAASRLDEALHRSDVSSARAQFEVLARVEEGQAETIVALLAPCGWAADSPTRAGAAAAALTALADSTIQSDGVSVTPLLRPGALGLVGRATNAPGESPESATKRIATAVAHRMLALVPTADAFERAKRTTIAQVAPWRASLLGLAAPEAPTALSAQGLPDELGRPRLLAARSARERLRSGPLRLVVLAHASAAQAQAADDAVSRFLPPWRAAAPCPSLPPNRATGGHAVVGSGEAAKAVHLGLVLDAATSLEALAAVEYLQAKAQRVASERSAHITVATEGQPLRGWLTLSVEAEKPTLAADTITTALRAAAPTDAEVDAALGSARQRRDLARVDPLQRMVDLLDPTFASAPSRDAVRQAIRRAAATLVTLEVR